MVTLSGFRYWSSVIALVFIIILIFFPSPMFYLFGGLKGLLYLLPVIGVIVIFFVLNASGEKALYREKNTSFVGSYDIIVKDQEIKISNAGQSVFGNLAIKYFSLGRSLPNDRSFIYYNFRKNMITFSLRKKDIKIQKIKSDPKQFLDKGQNASKEAMSVFYSFISGFNVVKRIKEVIKKDDVIFPYYFVKDEPILKITVKNITKYFETGFLNVNPIEKKEKKYVVYLSVFDLDGLLKAIKSC